MDAERARALCIYLQEELKLASSFCEEAQDNPEFRDKLYEKLRPLHEALCDALHSAYPDIDSLKYPIERELGESLGTIPQSRKIYTDTLFELIAWAESKGYLLELIAAAYKRNHGNPRLSLFVNRELKGLIRKMLPAVTVDEPAPPLQSLALDTSKQQFNAVFLKVQGEEAIVQPRAEFVPAGSQFERHQRCICRVEIPGLNPAGTGFLVGRHIVITNYHVMEPVIKGTAHLNQVVLRFGYQENQADKSLNRGVEYALVADKWLIEKSSPEQLDYALLRLNPTPISSPFIGGNDLEQRGCLEPKGISLHKDEKLWILQYPLGMPLSTTVIAGQIVKVEYQKQRVYYRVYYTTSTQNGSSGSPCITEDGTVVALHHRYNFMENTNEGIPFSAILADLRAKEVISLVCK